MIHIPRACLTCWKHRTCSRWQVGIMGGGRCTGHETEQQYQQSIREATEKVRLEQYEKLTMEHNPGGYGGY